MIPADYVLPCLCSAIGGFLFAMFALDNYYRRVFRMWVDEMHKQYDRVLREMKDRG